MTKKEIKNRLEYLRGEIEAEKISYGEIAELVSLAKHIESGDVLLLQWAGVPEGNSNRQHQTFIIRTSCFKHDVDFWLEDNELMGQYPEHDDNTEWTFDFEDPYWAEELPIAKKIYKALQELRGAL